jgi:hypothetical protein
MPQAPNTVQKSSERWARVDVGIYQSATGSWTVRTKPLKGSHRVMITKRFPLGTPREVVERYRQTMKDGRQQARPCGMLV